MNILIYISLSDSRSVFFESITEALTKKGYSLYILTPSSKGIFHKFISPYVKRADGFEVPHGILFYPKSIFNLIKYCRKYEINIVWSHLHQCNLVAIAAQYFIAAKVYPSRHHSDAVRIFGRGKSKIIDRIINIFSKKIIVVSDRVKEEMIKNEKVESSKISVLKLGYDFSKYFYSVNESTRIKLTYPAKLLLINIARMDNLKAHRDLIRIIKRLVSQNMDVTLLLLDEGPLKNELQNFVVSNELEKNIYFLGKVSDIMNYIKAADLMIHISYSEASSQVVKESSFMEIPVMVRDNVGDFNKYLKDKTNSFIIHNNEEAEKTLNEIYQGKHDLLTMGSNAKKSVLENFGIQNVIKDYFNFFENAE